MIAVNVRMSGLLSFGMVAVLGLPALGQTCVGDPECVGLTTACTVGVCNLGTLLCEALPANEGGPCDDTLFCTATDACVVGVCVGTGDPCIDGVGCTVDTCNDLLDSCANVATDALCTDGVFCNGAETCDPVLDCQASVNPCPGPDGDGDCAESCNEIANSCTADDPLGAACDDGDACSLADTCAVGFCIAGSPDPLCTPTLDLVADPGALPVGSCYGVGDFITVRVNMGASAPSIVGGQFFLEYDVAALAFVSMVPGDPPFTAQLFESVDPVNGTIDYAVNAPTGDPGTVAPTTMAVITFEAIAECDTFVRFRSHKPPTTLADVGGTPRLPALGDLAPTSINASAPLVTCPADIVVNADAGEITALVSIPPITASDSCDGVLPVNCTSSPTPGLVSGGVFPPGITTISCDPVINSCGIETPCSFTVEVTPFSEMTVDVELSATIVAGPLTRCITFEFHRCGVASASISHELVFGGAFATAGMSVNQDILAPAGAWECVTARDTLHTLRSTAPNLAISGTSFEASFVGDRAQQGHWLVGGNLDDSPFIEIVDFAIWSSSFGISFADTDCTIPRPHADINGDGIVTVADFTFIQVNFLVGSEANCCGLPEANGGPRAKISLRELNAMGMGDLSAADFNSDGVVGVEDIILMAEGLGTPVEPRLYQFLDTPSSITGSKTSGVRR